MTVKVFTLDADFDITAHPTKLEKNNNVSLLYQLLVGGTLNDNCTDFANPVAWSDDDFGNGESKTGHPAGQWHFDAPDDGALNYAQRETELGAIGNNFTLEVITSFDDLPSDIANGYWLVSVKNGEISLGVKIGQNGIYVYDGASYAQVNPTDWESPSLRTLRFLVTGFPWTAAKFDLYFDKTRIVTDGDCTVDFSAFDGRVTILTEAGDTLASQDILSHFDSFQLTESLVLPFATDLPKCKLIESGQTYSVDAGIGNVLCVNSFVPSVTTPAGTSIKYRWATKVASPWPVAGWSAWRTSAEMSVDINADLLDGKRYLFIEVQFISDGTADPILDDATVTYSNVCVVNPISGLLLLGVG